MSQSNAAGGTIAKTDAEAMYELPPFSEAVEAVMKAKSQSVQVTLEQLASNGYYIVRRKK